MVLHIIRTL